MLAAGTLKPLVSACFLTEDSAIASVAAFGLLSQIQISSAYQLSSAILVSATRGTLSSRLESHTVSDVSLHCPPRSLFRGVDSSSSIDGDILKRVTALIGDFVSHGFYCISGPNWQ